MSKSSQQAIINVETAVPDSDNFFDVLVIGGGAAGIGVTASLLRRRPSLRIAIVEPNDKHYYQPAWTLVGGGAYDVTKTVRAMSEVIPEDAHWLQAAATGLIPHPILSIWPMDVLSAISS